VDYVYCWSCTVPAWVVVDYWTMNVIFLSPYEWFSLLRELILAL
jgi:hypothetical protein